MTPPFETVYSSFETPLLRDAYIAVTECDAWEWLRNCNTQSFMFSFDPYLTRITQAMTYTGHSGASYGWTMRIMEDIAKHGWEAHKIQARRDRAITRLEHWAAERRSGVPAGEH